MDEVNWDDYMEYARRCAVSGSNYKALEADIKRCVALLVSKGDWAGHFLKMPENQDSESQRTTPSRNFFGSLCGGQQRKYLDVWVEKFPRESGNALRELWVPAAPDAPVSDEYVLDRIGTFEKVLKEVEKALIKKAWECEQQILVPLDDPMGLISVLLMALGVDRYPPFTRKGFEGAYGRLGYLPPDADADAAGLYKHALGFLDRVLDEARERGLKRPGNRLEARNIVYQWLREGNPTRNPAESGSRTSDSGQDSEPCDLQALADELLFDVAFFQRVETLLADKRQVIFQGPPGTGKTFVARKLAARLAGAPERVRLVQFHPSYAYEDFIQGYRPMLTDGQPGFALRKGPLLDMAERARDEPDARHFLVIDEINRGNLAKVFGELYYVLEYRDKATSLQYSDEPFSLPGNLYVIGTMNTADRSIALVDLALRRRFYFVEFHPDEPPVRGLLGRWLQKHAPGMAWVADIVDRANRALDDRQAAVGPSYFLKPDLDDEAVRLIWKHNVLPYVEERLAGEHDRLRDFDLDRLRASESDDGAGADDAGD